MSDITVRPIARADRPGWQPLWDGYNAFYGREGTTALPAAVTEATWERFFHDDEPMHALVAEEAGRIVGIVHIVLHRSTTRLANVCYLQDLYTAADRRGRGIGRLLIEAVYEQAHAAGSTRVYWQTHVTNAAGRALYDRVARHHGFIVYSQEL